MLSILGAVLFGIIAIMTVLVACGLPLGEFTMGGQHKILPKKFRVMAAAYVLDFSIADMQRVARQLLAADVCVARSWTAILIGGP